MGYSVSGYVDSGPSQTRSTVMTFVLGSEAPAEGVLVAHQAGSCATLLAATVRRVPVAISLASRFPKFPHDAGTTTTVSALVLRLVPQWISQ